MEPPSPPDPDPPSLWRRRRSDLLSMIGTLAVIAYFVVGFADGHLPPWWLLLVALWLSVGAPAADSIARGFARYLAEKYGPRP